MTNREFAASNKEFRYACEAVKLDPTSRQASKFRLEKGKARKEGLAIAVSRIRDELEKEAK